MIQKKMSEEIFINGEWRKSLLGRKFLLSFENVLIIGTAQNIPLNVHVNTLFMGSVLGLDYETVMRKWKIV